MWYYATPIDTSVAIHPEYYNANCPRYEMLWKQLAKLDKTMFSGVQIGVKIAIN